MAQEHGLSWGALQFAGSVDPDLDYQIHALADGSNFGNPQPLLEIVKSLLSDGSLAVLQGWDNREVPIRLCVAAKGGIAGPALAAAESALMAEVMALSKSPLVWVPPAQDAATCVFDVVAAKLERDNGEGWDFDEVKREERYYLLTLTCLPFARTEESVVAAAIAPPPDPGDPPVVVDIDTCSSFTGWSATYVNLTTTAGNTSGAYVYAGGTKGGAGTQSATLKRTGSVTMGATPILKVEAEWLAPGNSGGIGTVSFDGGVGVAPLAIQGTTYYYAAPASFTTLAITGGDNTALAGYRQLRVHNVAKTDGIAPVSGTTRQQSRSAQVAGSAPTQAAVRLYDATPAVLGADIMIYTSRNTSWTASLRPSRVSSAAVTPDATMVSGGRNTLTSAMTFEFPASAITEGTYALLARMNVTTGGDVGWSARMVDSTGATTLGSTVTASGTTALGVTSGYEVVTLASLGLPVVAVEDDQMIELTLTGTANMTLDEAWLFNLTDGALTWVREPTVQWVEVRSPELGAARPSVYGGTGAVGENGVCIDWACESFGSHRFDPGTMQVFTVTTSSLASQSELEFYPRYHSHVEGSAA